jgi:hypothetical protein
MRAHIAYLEALEGLDPPERSFVEKFVEDESDR